MTASVEKPVRFFPSGSRDRKKIDIENGAVAGIG